MTIDAAQLAANAAPRYLAIAEAIAADIAQGRLAPASRLPPQRELAYHLGVTVGTVTRAYRVLAGRGLVDGHVGRGTYVTDPGTASGAEPGPEAFIDLTKNAPPVLPSAEAIRAGLGRIAEAERTTALLDYAPTAGAEPHRAALAAWMGRVGLAAAPERVIVFGGAQQALAAALTALSGGRPVLVERLTYPGLISISTALKVPLAGVALDREGLSAEALDRAAAETGARLAVVVPTLQNPMNTVMGLERRRAIAAVARARGLTLVEDDVYGYVPETRPPPIASLAPELTVYLASASKCFAPGLRLGWALAPEGSREPLLRALYAMSVCRPPLTAELGRRWIEDGTGARLARAQAAEAAARQALAAELLAGHRLHGHPASFHVFLELPAAWSAEAFAAAARARGVGVVPAEAFNAGPEPAPRAVRISLSQAPGRASLTRALAALAALAADAPRPPHGII